MKKNNRHFSFLELITVMAIISVIMLVAVPAFVRPKNNSMEAVVRQITTLMETARTVAMKTGQSTGVSVDISTKTFSTNAKIKSHIVVPLANPDAITTADKFTLPDHFSIELANPYTEAKLPPVRDMKVTQDENTVSFEFRPDGTGMMPGLRIRDEESRKEIVLSVMPLTGRIHIEEE